MITLAAIIAFAWPLWVGPRPTLADLEFTMAVEESIMAEPGATPPDFYRCILEAMGSDAYLEREAATRVAREAFFFDQRMLFWGRKNPAPEVRLRSNSVLRRINLCPACRGSGASRHYREDPCWDCHGVGSVWPYSSFSRSLP